LQTISRTESSAKTDLQVFRLISIKSTQQSATYGQNPFTGKPEDSPIYGYNGGLLTAKTKPSAVKQPFIHPWRLRLAREVIHAGGLIAYPTEAVYGLGCHPLDRDAVARLLKLKQRPQEKGLILIADCPEALYPYLGKIPQQAWQRVVESWPGPNTWVIPAAEETPAWLSGKFDSIAVRVTDQPIAAALCRAAGTPLVSTSANLSQRPPARTPLQVRTRCGLGVDLVIHGKTGGLARPTAIRDALKETLIRR
jgi:L-threonylcarbamoyladenylate synthase